MSFAFLPGKMFICMVNRHRGEQIVAAAKAAGARGGTMSFGRTLADTKFLQALSLAEVQQDIVFILMRDEAPAVVNAIGAACREHPQKLGGIAVLLDVSGMMIRLPHNPAGSAEPSVRTRSERMESEYTLLTVIVNNGYADDVMAKARKAGAKGEVILTGRGTASEADVRFFGITLVPEKEMLMIVVKKKDVDAVVAAICEVPALAKPGGGIVYTMPVEQFMVLGQ
jgi:Nitrogen regulatory protein PII